MASRSETLRTLTTESLAAKEASLDLLNWHRWHRRATRKRMASDVIAQAEEQRTLAANLLGEHIRNIHALLYRTEEEAVPHRADLIRQSSLLMLGSVWALEPRRIRGFLNDIAPFFDTMNDSINAQLIALRKTVETARQMNPDG